MLAKKIQSALISVYDKENLSPIIKLLALLKVKIYSTAGTQQFIKKLGVKVTALENVTGFPPILGGRVKTLHPKIFGGILGRSAVPEDQKQLTKHQIPTIDLVIVDLYPFASLLKAKATEADMIEKIDIGGVSLIRAAAKNYQDVLVVATKKLYPNLIELLQIREGVTHLTDRKFFATHAFQVTAHYDTIIFNYFNQTTQINAFNLHEKTCSVLRYGENPHQEGKFFGDFEAMFDQINGKQLSYNNLVDIDAAVNLMEAFEKEIVFAILKHTNACGIAIGHSVKEAFQKALAADTVSAFGGVLITNHIVDFEAAQHINDLFFEILIASDYEKRAFTLLKNKKNRIILIQKKNLLKKKQFKSLLNGLITQDCDVDTNTLKNWQCVTQRQPTHQEKATLLFANKVVKHSKSNAIVLANSSKT